NVTKRWEGSCTEISKNSNKFYHCEIQVASNGQARIFTTYGRVGKAGTEEYRYYPSENACLSDYESLIRKKRDRKKDPYREVDLAITAVGSDGAKEIKKPMTGIDVKGTKKSKLHKEVQRLVNNWFGSTGTFIEMNLKCPLGQLSKEQIDKGRNVLDDCKTRVLAKKKTANPEYDRLTSQFYSLIPHVLPHKINPDTLRLDTIDKIMEKHDTLDTFLDAKNVQSVLGKGSLVDDKYKQLKAELAWIDPQDPVYEWIEKLLHSTRARNHGWLGNVKIYNIYALKRNSEGDHFNHTLAKIAEEVKNPTKPRYTKLTRPDLTKEDRKLFTKANVWPLWHGTRPQNMVGIITRGLLIRPSGAVHTGSMFGDAIYSAEASSKAMNYCGCRGAYWSGSSNNDRVFVFLQDVIVGNAHIVQRSQFFRQPPKGCHSVYAVPGGGLVNSENMIYQQAGAGQQHRMRYIVEFQSQAR
ncbi:MAG: WGR domain-containing protein, partial [bacterium]